MANSQHHEKLAELFQRLTAQFLEIESNRTSLITVTKFDLAPKLGKGIAFITVLPESAEAAALDFAKRKRSDLREYFKKHSRTRVIPFIDFEIDKGEKNRQRIDELLRGDE